jgi:Zn ribbon nucleic-acid-binding protein
MATYMGMGHFECPNCGVAYRPSYWGDDDLECIDCLGEENSPEARKEIQEENTRIHRYLQMVGGGIPLEDVNEARRLTDEEVEALTTELDALLNSVP